MTSSLSSMNGSCLQQRDAASSYPYMFHDPLHSLSSTYNHSRAAAVSAACNSAAAHQNSVNTHSSYGTVGSSSTGPSGTGKKNISPPSFPTILIRFFFFFLQALYQPELAYPFKYRVKHRIQCQIIGLEFSDLNFSGFHHRGY